MSTKTATTSARGAESAVKGRSAPAEKPKQAPQANGKPVKSGADDVTNHFGLDLGTSRIVLAHMDGDEPVYSSHLNAFISLPSTKMNRTMLEREHIYCKAGDDEILAFGNRVDEFANILGGDTRRPMQSGLLNPREPKNLEVMRLMLAKICGPAKAGQRICFSVPSAPESGDTDVIFHEQAVQSVLEGLGYNVRSINEGLAVVLAELVNNDFTGIGISFGGGMCNVCVAYLGLPAIVFATTRAGDFIDYSAASVTGETPTTVRLHKESDDFSIAKPDGSSLDQATAIYYREVIQTVTLTLERTLSKSRRLPPFRAAVPVVYGGGTAMVDGFGDELRKAFGRIKLPILIKDIRQAESGVNATAKGGLLASLLES